MPTTSRFWIAPEKRYLQSAAGYITLISPAPDRAPPPVANLDPMDDPECLGPMQVLAAMH